MRRNHHTHGRWKKHNSPLVIPLTKDERKIVQQWPHLAQTSPAGSGEINITQHFTISGNGDAALKQAMEEAAARGARDGAKLARQETLKDFQTNGPARRMLNV